MRRIFAMIALMLASHAPAHHQQARTLPKQHRPADRHIDLSWMDVTRAPDWNFWRCTAIKETGLRWNFVSHSNKYAGAFAIARSTWLAYGGIAARLYPQAETAQPFVQIIGARHVKAAVGTGKWGGARACS